MRQDSRLDQVRPFTEWKLRIVGSTYELGDLMVSAVRGRATALLGEIIDAEWPIHPRRLGRLANNAFGLSKVSNAREVAILECLDKAKYRQDKAGFIWPIEIDPGRWRGYRTGTLASPDMSMAQISHEEIANAMEAVLVKESHDWKDDLFRATAFILGGKRLPTGESWYLVDEGLDFAVRRKSIRRLRGTFKFQGRGH